MADKAVRMVVVDGVRYRPEHAPKTTEKRDDEKPAENKMRTTKSASKK